jgi:hypothetical protein
VTADIEQWDRQVLERLMERGSMTAGQISEAVEPDGFELPIAQTWVASALERGFIAKTGGSSGSTRYSIMAAGRDAAAARTGRFVSEQTGGGKPSRRS